MYGLSIDAWLAERTNGTTLGGQAERVVKVLARAPQFASYASAREVAERAGVNVSTVVRAAQQLGFEGWPDLRQKLRALYLGSVTAGDMVDTDETGSVTAMLQQDAANLAALTTAENVEQIRAIGAAIRAARRTVVLATGTGTGPAHILGYVAGIHGYDVHSAVGPPTEQALHVSRLGPGDCLVVINVWRLTRTMRALTRMAHDQGVTVAVLTDLRSSPLTASADHFVLAPIEGVDRTPSLTAMVAAIQAILADLAEQDGGGTSGRVEQAWNDLDLMDDQA